MSILGKVFFAAAALTGFVVALIDDCQALITGHRMITPE